MSSSILTLQYVPERGDIIWLDFDPQAGHEQAKRRPALVLSPVVYNARFDLAIVCPITSQTKGYNWEVKVPPGLLANGYILSDQVKSSDWKARNAVFICQLPQSAFDDVIAKLTTLLT